MNLFEDLSDNRGLPGGENAPAVETSRNSNDSGLIDVDSLGVGLWRGVEGA